MKLSENICLFQVTDQFITTCRDIQTIPNEADFITAKVIFFYAKTTGELSDLSDYTQFLDVMREWLSNSCHGEAGITLFNAWAHWIHFNDPTEAMHFKLRFL